MVKVCSFSFALALVASGTVLGAENQAQQDQAPAWQPAPLLVSFGDQTYPINLIPEIQKLQEVIHSVPDQAQFFETLESMTEENVAETLFLYCKVFYNIHMDGVRQSDATYTFGSLATTTTKPSEDGQHIYVSNIYIDRKSPYNHVHVLMPVSSEDYKACQQEGNLLEQLLWHQKETGHSWQTSLSELKALLQEK